MLRLVTLSYRIRDTAQLRQVLGQHAGARRFAYNWALEQLLRHDALADEDLIGPLSAYALLKRWSAAKASWPWLREVSKWAPERGVVDCHDTWQRWRQGLTREPKFRRRKSGTASFRFPQSQGSIKAHGDKLLLPKVGWIRLRLSRPIVGEIRNVTVKEVFTGKWEVRVQVEQEHEVPERKGGSVGLDLGVHHAVATSDGEFFENPRLLQHSLSKLKRLNKRAARQVKGSKRQRRTFDQIARLHYRVAQQRRDWQHKVSSTLVQQSGVIATEDLNVRGMVKNRRLARAISDVGMSSFVSKLGYKLAWANGEHRKCGRFEPSSQCCSTCGWRDEELTLAQREFRCRKCGLTLDRDTNAAKNVLAWSHGLGDQQARGGEPVAVPRKRVARGRWSRERSRAPAAGCESRGIPPL